MKNLIIVFFLLISTSFAFAANSEAPVVVDKITLSIDQHFFNSCLGSMRPYFDNLETCVIYRMPSDRKLFADGGFLNLMNYMVRWSAVTCEKESLGRLSVRMDEYGDILLSARSRACLQKIADLVLNFKGTQDQSFYLISK